MSRREISLHRLNRKIQPHTKLNSSQLNGLVTLIVNQQSSPVQLKNPKFKEYDVKIFVLFIHFHSLLYLTPLCRFPLAVSVVPGVKVLVRAPVFKMASVCLRNCAVLVWSPLFLHCCLSYLLIA